ncbi:hypothetical protein LG291_25140 (plasmid) [Cytobacillus firmus]|uniref:hypothetical protein n=1 Tax=Bacillaceae TaxID=186817 RepID=UPI0013634C3C|nr:MULTISPECIES: hypothetical protein [Bacillaceae]MBN8203872.1 hypothetical protein [Bacillus sp. NTK034]
MKKNYNNAVKLHKLIIGSSNNCYKAICINEKEFKKEFAPPNAKFEHVEIYLVG